MLLSCRANETQIGKRLAVWLREECELPFEGGMLLNLLVKIQLKWQSVSQMAIPQRSLKIFQFKSLNSP